MLLLLIFSDLIIYNLHNYKLDKRTEDDESEDGSTEGKVLNARCVELTRCIEQGFVNKSYIIAIYKIQERLLKQV